MSSRHFTGHPWWLSSKESHLSMQETQEIWVRPLGQKDSPEKEEATHSSILAWATPWTEEPAGIQSMGSQRVRHTYLPKQQQQETSLRSLSGHS